MSMAYDWTTVAGGPGLNTITVDASTMANISLSGITAGQVLTTNGSGAYNWADTTISVSQDLFPNTLSCNGDANFEGDIKIKGRSLTDMFDKIEERLAILHPNEVLEDKWEKLKELGRQYREMEKDILEKEKIWKILNR